jgi:hypothetical protein
MTTFQTMISLVLLIFVLSVIVQAVQEVIKALLNTKAKTIEQIVEQFMGDHLTLQQVTDALKQRGLNITALEGMDRNDFRQLLDAVPFQDAQLKGVVANAQATVDQVKDNIAASYEAARAAFQKLYSSKNKLMVVIVSFCVVVPLNANIIGLYNQVSTDAVVQQALVSQASEIQGKQSQVKNLKATYAESRNTITDALTNDPILNRFSEFGTDFKRPVSAIIGLLLMGVLVSLGAPFWNDVLKGMMGVNNALNTSGKKSP